MSDKKELPHQVKKHLDKLGQKVGNEAQEDMENVLLELMNTLEVTSVANPIESSALFLARPTGYDA